MPFINFHDISKRGFFLEFTVTPLACGIQNPSVVLPSFPEDIDTSGSMLNWSPNIIATDDHVVFELHPTNQGLVKVPVFNFCIEMSRFDVAAIPIHGSELIKVDATVPLAVAVLDVLRHPFSMEGVKIMKMNVAIMISAGASSVAILPQDITVHIRSDSRINVRIFDTAFNTLRFRFHRYAEAAK
uniref:BPI2 domain-containing protein n=1 Tax=Panagrellus redivivus TaxID=6233 RepID=A0A7E4W1V2_PANRE